MTERVGVSTCRRQPGGGHVPACRHAPGCSTRSGSGRAGRRTNTWAAAGPAPLPPRRCSSKNAMASAPASMAGPWSGRTELGAAPRADEQAPWDAQVARRAERARLAAVGPAGDEHRRAGDALVAGTVRVAAGSSRSSSSRRPRRAASRAPTARCRRCVVATRRPTRRRRRPARAAGRSSPPCVPRRRRGRWPAARRPCGHRPPPRRPARRRRRRRARGSPRPPSAARSTPSTRCRTSRRARCTTAGRRARRARRAGRPARPPGGRRGDATRRARAAEVEAADGEAGGGECPVPPGGGRGDVVHPVRQRLEQDRPRTVARWQVEVGAQPNAVVGRDPDRLAPHRGDPTVTSARDQVPPRPPSRRCATTGSTLAP